MFAPLRVTQRQGVCDLFKGLLGLLRFLYAVAAHPKEKARDRAAPPLRVVRDHRALADCFALDAQFPDTCPRGLACCTIGAASSVDNDALGGLGGQSLVKTRRPPGRENSQLGQRHAHREAVVGNDISGGENPEETRENRDVGRAVACPRSGCTLLDRLVEHAGKE